MNIVSLIEADEAFLINLTINYICLVLYKHDIDMTCSWGGKYNGVREVLYPAAIVSHLILYSRRHF